MKSAIRVLSPTTLRTAPQLACLHLLAHAIDMANIALYAAHPDIERRDAELLPIDELADRVVDATLVALDTIHRYEDLLYDLYCRSPQTLFDDDGGLEF